MDIKESIIDYPCNHYTDLPSNFMKETNINDVEPTTHIKFSSDALYLAVSRGNTTYVYNTSVSYLAIEFSHNSLFALS